ncbi:Glycoside hydrolase family 42 domain protein, partial [mine drainage metagenome]
EFLGHYGLGAPNEVGMDFYFYHGGREYTVGYPQYVRWIPVLSRIHGAYPLQPVAIYISYQSAFTNPVALAGMSSRLAGIWRKLNMAFTVVTDREVAAGVVRLGQFRAILPLNGWHDRAMTDYTAHGGHVLNHAAQLTKYAPAYLTFAPSDGGRVEATPTVNRAARMAWITLSGWQPGARPYAGVATIHLNGLGLDPGHYHIMNAATGQPIAGFGTPDQLRVPLRIAPGDLLVWRILPGPG